jgi:ABC-2 type transport system ATP-binding protein
MIIEVEGLVKHYGKVTAVDGVSFGVEHGETFGLLGPNGAGKVTVSGFDLRKDSRKVRSVIGFCPQETLLYDLLSVRENFSFSASLYSLDRRKFKERVEFSSKVLGVGEFLDRRVGQLSGGMKRRANLAASIIHDPPIVILDEPTVGFDPTIKREFWELIKNLRKSGKTVLLSTHDMYEADEICDRVAIMEKGKIAALDRPHILKKTIGGGTSIHIRVKESQVKRALAVLKEYKTVSVDDEIQVLVDDPWQNMTELSAKLNSEGVLTEKIEIVEPSLEDVFMKLSGRRLTEDGN